MVTKGKKLVKQRGVRGHPGGQDGPLPHHQPGQELKRGEVLSLVDLPPKYGLPGGQHQVALGQHVHGLQRQHVHQLQVQYGGQDVQQLWLN